MPDEADPPRKFYSLKPKEFEAVNDVPRAAPGPEPAPRARPPEAARPDGKIELRDVIRGAALDPQARVLAGPGERGVAENDVRAMLRDNHAREESAGLYELAPKPKRKSKRKRDYLLTMLTANPVLVVLFALALKQNNALLLAYAGAGIVLVNVSVTWVMWFVMDDY